MIGVEQKHSRDDRPEEVMGVVRARNVLTSDREGVHRAPWGIWIGLGAAPSTGIAKTRLNVKSY